MYTMFDTHTVTKKLEERGMSCLQVETIVSAMRGTQSCFLTKEDGAMLEERLSHGIDKVEMNLDHKINTLELRFK